MTSISSNDPSKSIYFHSLVRLDNVKVLIQDYQYNFSQKSPAQVALGLRSIGITLGKLGYILAPLRNPHISSELRSLRRAYDRLKLRASPPQNALSLTAGATIDTVKKTIPLASSSTQAVDQADTTKPSSTASPKLTGTVEEELREITFYHSSFLRANTDDIFARNALLSQLLHFQMTFPNDAARVFRLLPQEGFFDRARCQEVKNVLSSFNHPLPRTAFYQLREIWELLGRLQEIVDREEAGKERDTDDQLSESTRNELRSKLLNFRKTYPEAAKALFAQYPFENFFDDAHYPQARKAIERFRDSAKLAPWNSPVTPQEAPLPIGLAHLLSEINICLHHKNLHIVEDGDEVRKDLNRYLATLEKDFSAIAKELFLSVSRAQFFQESHLESAKRSIDSLLRTGQPFLCEC